MRDQIINYARAGYPGIYLLSHEEARAEAELKSVAETLNYGLHAWSATTGLVDTSDGNTRDMPEPLEAVMALAELPENTILLLRDFHQFLEDSNPILTRALKDMLARAKTCGKVLVILGCRQVLPPELQHEFIVLDFALPDKTQLGTVLDGICQSGEIAKLKGDRRDQVLDAATGMTCAEAENAFALSLVTTKRVDAGIVAKEKAATVKKNGLLEVVDVRETLDDIGGLDQLKAWLLKRKDAFSQRARDYGLPSPKGLLIIGTPGTGKTLTAKATASVLGRPLLKLDAGKLYGSLVGQSEENLRSVIQVAEAIAPCILFIDEIEKGFAGSRSSGATDGGTSARVFGTLLSWMNDKTAPVFVVATANDVQALPPEFLRKGRWDDMFVVDLPNAIERRAIWEIHIRKHDRDPDKFDTVGLVKGSEGFTGAEIEQVFIEGMYIAFAESREPTTLDLSTVLAETVPLAKLMSEQIAALRQWSKGRARPASTPEHAPSQRRIAA